MVKLPRLMAAPALSLVLSLSLFSSGALAQSFERNLVNSTHQSIAAKPANGVRPYDGPSPGENDFNGFGDGGNTGNGFNGGNGFGGSNGFNGGNGFGGGHGFNGGNGFGGSNGFNGNNGFVGDGVGGGRLAGWHNRPCFQHHCGGFSRNASKCVRSNGELRSHWDIRRQGFSACKWIKAERW